MKYKEILKNERFVIIGDEKTERIYYSKPFSGKLEFVGLVDRRIYKLVSKDGIYTVIACIDLYKECSPHKTKVIYNNKNFRDFMILEFGERAIIELNDEMIYLENGVIADKGYHLCLEHEDLICWNLKS